MKSICLSYHYYFIVCYTRVCGFELFEKADRNRVLKIGVRIRDEDPTFFFTDSNPDPAGEKMQIHIRLEKNADPDPTLNQNEEKNILIF